MATITCYPADYNLPPGVNYGALTLRGHAAADYFAQAGGQANLQMVFDWSRRNALPRPPDIRGLYDQDLLHGLTTLLAPNGGAPLNIGLIFGNNFLNGQGQAVPQYGVMFDLDVQGSLMPRQGCAIFLGPLILTAQAAGLDAQGLAEFVAFTVIHELGHAFNLWHVPGSGSIMEPHYDPSNLGSCTFIPLEQQYLAMAANPDFAPFVLPGYKPFNVRPDGWPVDSDPPFAGPMVPIGRRPSLHIALSHSSFWSFEPIELDIEVRSPRSTQTSSIVPDEIDLGHNSFHIWITDPTGARYRVRPQFRFCQPNGERTIAAGDAFRRDISLFRQAGGAVFSSPGVHTVQAALKLPSGQFLSSNIVECEVRPAMPESEHWLAAREALEPGGVVDLLRFKRRLPPAQDYERLLEFATHHASPETNAAIHFSLGKTALRIVESVPASTEADYLQTIALQRLRGALETNALGAHRVLTTQNLVSRFEKRPDR
jgi:hypothetical protein